ncbi:MAG: septum formation protein Maf [Clostridia bacterium]|nr:septum formation protein Maf [Clostridia bacterium]
MIKIVLASASKTRRDILDRIGLVYEIVPSNAEEQSTAKDPAGYVRDLALLKAASTAKKVAGNALILAADTVIYKDGKIYGKPTDREDAFQNLRELAGGDSFAYTGTVVYDPAQNKQIAFGDVCRVTLKKMTDEEIRWYVEKEENLLHISGYAMLGKAALFLDGVEGDYHTLFGLSPGKLYDAFRQLGYRLSDFEWK